MPTTPASTPRTTYTATAKGLPIYWLNGSKVADDYEDFYDGDWDDEANPRDRSGAVSFPSNGEVWTGSNSNGTASSSAFGDSTINIGRLNGTGILSVRVRTIPVTLG